MMDSVPTEKGEPMIKRFCDRCNKEIKPDKDIMKPFRWWTITMHSRSDVTLELCDECGKATMWEFTRKENQ